MGDRVTLFGCGNEACFERAGYAYRGEWDEAAEFGVNATTIYAIRAGRIWGWL